MRKSHKTIGKYIFKRFFDKAKTVYIRTYKKPKKRPKNIKKYKEKNKAKILYKKTKKILKS